ncbi:hypothetical protein EPI10_021067 [Gossypium australe]|uniref:Uncharacterized protein n=1 Tax=Gossypium australe TaxID=47621 RepID=A0A5B6WG93_9ROSI|nr:hypothetical protein EPI10_021067 [Gossypium australe]
MLSSLGCRKFEERKRIKLARAFGYCIAKLRSRTEENEFRSRENESNRVAISVPVKLNSRSSKLLKARGPSRIIITLLNLFWYF